MATSQIFTAEWNVLHNFLGKSWLNLYGLHKYHKREKYEKEETAVKYAHLVQICNTRKLWVYVKYVYEVESTLWSSIFFSINFLSRKEFGKHSPF